MAAPANIPVAAPLTRRAAAAQLGVSVATLKRITANGVGVISRGGGRGNESLYDVHVIRATNGMLEQSPEMLATLERGTRALTVCDAVADQAQWLFRAGSLADYEVPVHRRRELLDFIATVMAGRLREHLRLDSKLAQE